MTNAKSLWHINPSESAILDYSLVAANEFIRLRSLYSLISLGTERTVALGQVPVSMYENMRVPFMEGNFDFPIKYGYSVVAQSEDGSLYHLMHPHQDILLVDPNYLRELPVDLPPERACLISNMETALNAYWDSEVMGHESILIVGFGLIGSLIAGLLKLNGFDRITILESNPVRSEIAIQMGFKLMQPTEFKDQYFNLAFHTSANPDGLQSCLDKMSLEGRIIEMSWYGNRISPIKLGESFHYNRLTIKSSQVSHIPLKMQDKWDFKKRKSEAIRILLNPYWEQYQFCYIPFDKAPQLFEKIRQNKTDELTYLLKY